MLQVEAIFVVHTLPFHDGDTSYDAMYGIQHACLPDLKVLYFLEGKVNTRVRQTFTKTTIQMTTVDKINLAQRGNPFADGAKLYKKGDRNDYYHEPHVKDGEGNRNSQYEIE